MKLPISIGILAWNSGITLENTLQSYKNNGLLEMVSECTILFQEVSETDKKIAEKYNIPYIGLETNIGIGKAFLQLTEQSSSKYVMLLEHDWVLTSDMNNTYEQLLAGIDMLEKVDVVRYRSRKNPGNPLFSFDLYYGKELSYDDPFTGLTSPHMFDCIHWINHPHIIFPDHIKLQDNFFISNSRWANWTNNPCLYKKDFYIDCVRQNIDDRDLLLEPVIISWWANKNFTVASGEGLFTHKDLKKYGDL